MFGHLPVEFKPTPSFDEEEFSNQPGMPLEVFLALKNQQEPKEIKLDMSVSLLTEPSADPTPVRFEEREASAQEELDRLHEIIRKQKEEEQYAARFCLFPSAESLYSGLTAVQYDAFLQRVREVANDEEKENSFVLK